VRVVLERVQVPVCARGEHAPDQDRAGAGSALDDRAPAAVDRLAH
jgi:hypothetical protein